MSTLFRSLTTLLLMLVTYGVYTPSLLAQTAPNSSFPRYAVGASLFTGRYYIFYSDRLVENLVFNPAELTVCTTPQKLDSLAGLIK